MKSLVLTGNATLEVAERPRPEPSPEAPVVIRVGYAGVCGSDIPRAFDGGAYHYPLVLGHEFAGTVEEAPASSAYRPGDRVAVFPLIPDMDEPVNQIGEYAVSRGYDYFGSRRDGAFQEYLAVPEWNLFRVPDGLSMEAAAMTEPCAVAYHAAARPDVAPGESAAVLGGGPIGLMVAQWLRERGCDPVFVSELDPKKLALASDLGLTPIDASGDAVAEIRDRTDGGADVVVEAVGHPATFRQALAAAGLFGRVVFLGNIHGTFTLEEREFSTILRRELTIFGTWNSKVAPRGRDEWTRVLAALGSRVRVEPLISHRVGLDDAAGTLAAMHERSIWFSKVMLRLDAGLEGGVA